MTSATDRHTLDTCMAMQLDTHSTLVPRLKETILQGQLANEIFRETQRFSDEDQRKGMLALEILRDFDGDMATGSKGAALVSALLESTTKDIFLDELEPEDSRAWKSFCVINNESYNATCDHLIVRGDESPFWDDTKTPLKETKAAIIARSLVHATTLLEKNMGPDPDKWTWGELHTSTWETEVYKMLPSMGFIERTVMRVLRPYFNRGPYPTPGDYFTLNVSGYMMGQNFDTWLIPAMRLIVDFSSDEPMFAVNSSGNSFSSVRHSASLSRWSIISQSVAF
jgi:acyl-homoserine-lactone acylase